MEVHMTTSVSLNGLDISSIVTSAVQMKTSQMNSAVQNKIQKYNNSLSGLGTLSSYMSTFQDKIKTAKETSNYNINKTLTDNSGNNDTYGIDVKATDTVSEDELDIKVKQLAEKSKITHKFNRDFTNNFHSGTINFDLGNDKKFSVTVNAGDSLAKIRQNINENNPYGVTASLVNSSSGYVLTLNNDYDFSMSFDGDVANDFAQSEVTNTEAKPAIMEVNGVEIQSDTNYFDQVEGLEIHANYVSESHVSVSRDTDKQKENIDNFVDDFNNLLNSIDKLGKRNTYTDGVSNEDGGLLAGNSSLKRIKEEFKNTIGNQYSEFGLSFDRYGKLQYEENDDLTFSEKQEKIDEIFDKMSAVIDKFLEEDSEIEKQKESINNALDDANAKLERNNVYIQKYEDMMNKKYSNLDSIISNGNTKISLISSLFGTTQ